MKSGRRGLAVLLALAMCAAFAAAAADGDTAPGIPVELNRKMATRTGPGTRFTEPGTFFSAGTVVTAISAAWDGENEIWWIQTEFTYKGELRRAYTGLKRLNMTADMVPTEYVLAESAVLNRTVYAYMGPGYRYTMYRDPVPAGTEGTVWMSENDYAQFEFYDANEGMYRRVWIPESALEAPNG